MTEPLSPAGEEIFAFAFESPEDPHAGNPRIVYADDQDPRLLTEAEVVALLHARLIERTYVGERMAAIVHLLLWGELWRDSHDARLRHNGAANLLVFLRRAAPDPYPPRGTERLDRIAARILLGRARRRLTAGAEDAEAAVVADAMREELGRIG